LDAPAQRVGDLRELRVGGIRVGIRLSHAQIDGEVANGHLAQVGVEPLDFDRDASGAFAPSVVPNPDLVERAEEQRGVMDWANSLARTRRHLRFNRRLNTGVALPVLVSEGDSWFQFPVFLEDVIDCLGDDYLIWSVDAAGDTLQNMVIDNPEYLDALDTQRDRVRAFLFSGAGNDIVGEDSDGVPVIEKIVRLLTRPAARVLCRHARVRRPDRLYRRCLS
ncbi:MAG TPA: hypothetical protein PLQ12_03605, partial [Candidatus Defluviicoccus seviourii]|nr:hypothetical protein [Candidatus Defluviicoccus seviourii]